MRIAKAFFGKNSCLKLEIHEGIYIRMGKKNEANWDWRNIKISDLEAAEIVRVLEHKQEAASFYHTFKQNINQIYLSYKENILFFKVNEITKSLTPQEQMVFRILLERGIELVNIQTEDMQKEAVIKKKGSDYLVKGRGSEPSYPTPVPKRESPDPLYH